jgi:hypothetical protein
MSLASGSKRRPARCQGKLPTRGRGILILDSKLPRSILLEGTTKAAETTVRQGTRQSVPQVSRRKSHEKNAEPPSPPLPGISCSSGRSYDDRCALPRRVRDEVQSSSVSLMSRVTGDLPRTRVPVQSPHSCAFYPLAGARQCCVPCLVPRSRSDPASNSFHAILPEGRWGGV